MRRSFALARFWKIARLAALSALVLAPLAASAPIRTDRWLADVKYLSSDALKGRGDGTPELDQAAHYIARQFRQAGLQPLNGSYFQPFEATVGVDLGPHNRLASLGPAAHSYKLHRDYIPLSMSSSGRVSGGLAFVGYGITAPEYRYDDYAGINVRGRIVIVLRYEPQQDDRNSIFLGKRLTRHAALFSKAINARNHGAAAMVLVNDPLGSPSPSNDKLISFGYAGAKGMGIPVIQVKRAIADQWLGAADHSLAALQGAIDRDLSNHSFLLPSTIELKVHTDVRYRRRTLRNVVGLLPGSDPQLRDQVIVLGAHYDHLGLGQYGSLAPDKVGQIFHGADDNASGTAGIMEVARVLGADQHPLRRSVLFIAFSGEELGLFGSAYYVDHPLIPLRRTIAMINLDMIGRVRQDKLYIGGVSTSPGFRHLVSMENKDLSLEPGAIGTALGSSHAPESAKEEAFRLNFSDSGYDGSDHMSFGRKHVPVLFFFSGLHADYHKPSDTWEKLKPAATGRVLDLVGRVIREIDATDQRPVFTPIRENKRYAALSSGGGQGYGPYFGSVPDFGNNGDGVRFADVTAGSPAFKAGLRGGDTLIEFGGQPIHNLYDFTYALRAKSPGDEVPVIVLRNGQRVKAVVKLARRE